MVYFNTLFQFSNYRDLAFAWNIFHFSPLDNTAAICVFTEKFSLARLHQKGEFKGQNHGIVHLWSCKNFSQLGSKVNLKGEYNIRYKSAQMTVWKLDS